ncbi:MAG: MEDS domain-containing protein [Solirubrobacterales bacterium]
MCWMYADDAEFRAAAVEFLVDGRRLDQGLLYIGDGPEEKLRADLDSLDDLDSLIDGGTLRVLSLQELQALEGPIDAEAQLTAYVAATDLAVEAGHTGLRVVSEVTAMVTASESWPAHTRWESLADRSISSRPVTALCCYDRRRLPDSLLSDLAAVHPASHAPARMAPFRFFSREPDTLALEGEVDYFSADDLVRLLEMAPDAGGEVSLDLGGLGFVDHHGVMALIRYARSIRAKGVLSFKNVPHPVARLCELMGVAL